MAERNSASLKLTGFKELEAALLKLPKELASIAEAAALREGMKPVHAAAKSFAVKGKGPHAGLLAKSIGLTVRRVRRKLQYMNRYTARVGPKSGFRVSLGTAIARKDNPKRGRVKGKPYQVFKDPRFYAHLVEFGTSHSPAKPFIRPAMESSESKIMEGLQKGYEKGLEKVIKKIRSRK
jgi:HK97 gp10 family phage protein